MCFEECHTERETRSYTDRPLQKSHIEQYRKPFRHEQFLNDMNRVVPWVELVTVIEPVYPKADGPGRPPVGIERMLQQWFTMSDHAVEEALYDSRAMR